MSWWDAFDDPAPPTPGPGVQHQARRRGRTLRRRRTTGRALAIGGLLVALLVPVGVIVAGDGDSGTDLAPADAGDAAPVTTTTTAPPPATTTAPPVTSATEPTTDPSALRARFDLYFGFVRRGGRLGGELRLVNEGDRPVEIAGFRGCALEHGLWPAGAFDPAVAPVSGFRQSECTDALASLVLPPGQELVLPVGIDAATTDGGPLPLGSYDVGVAWRLTTGLVWAAPAEITVVA